MDARIVAALISAAAAILVGLFNRGKSSGAYSVTVNSPITVSTPAPVPSANRQSIWPIALLVIAVGLVLWTTYPEWSSNAEQAKPSTPSASTGASPTKENSGDPSPPPVDVAMQAQATINGYNALLEKNLATRSHDGFDQYFEPTVRFYRQETPRDNLIETFFGRVGHPSQTIREPAQIVNQCLASGDLLPFATVVHYRAVGEPSSANKSEPTVIYFMKDSDGRLRISAMGRGDCSNVSQ